MVFQPNVRIASCSVELIEHYAAHLGVPSEAGPIRGESSEWKLVKLVKASKGTGEEW